jgi:hypothetical protein
MRIQVSVLLFLLSFSLYAHESEQELRDLFDRYDQVMSGEKMKTTEVFSRKFLEDFDSENLIEKKNKAQYKLEIKEGLRDKNILFVKRVFEAKDLQPTTFIIVKEKNSWRIEGTTSDDH